MMGRGRAGKRKKASVPFTYPGRGMAAFPERQPATPLPWRPGCSSPTPLGREGPPVPPQPVQGCCRELGVGVGAAWTPPPRRAQSVPVGHTGAEDTLPVKPGAAACPRRVCLGPRRSRVMRAEADTAPDPGRLQSSSHRPTGSGQDRGPHAAWAPRVCQARGRARREYTPTRGTRLCTLLPGSTDVHKEVTRRSGHRTSRSVVIWGRVV